MAQQQQNLDLVTQARNAVIQLSNLVSALGKAFPQNTGTSTVATAGAATLPENPVGFIHITLQDGTQVRVPYYNP